MYLFVESNREAYADSGRIAGTWRWVMSIGAAMGLLGAAAIGTSIFVTLMTIIFLGALLFVGGALQLVNAITLRRPKGCRLDIAAGLIYTVAGLMIATNPEATALAFSLILSFFLVGAGFFRILAGFVGNEGLRPWQVLQGVLNLSLAYVIWHDWPVAGFSLIGILIGLELLGNGIALVMLALMAKRSAAQR